MHLADTSQQPIDWYGMKLSPSMYDAQLDRIFPGDIIVRTGAWDHLNQKEGRDRPRSAWWNVVMVDPSLSQYTTQVTAFNVDYLVLLVTSQSLLGGLPWGIRQDSRLTGVSGKSRVLTVVPLERLCRKHVSDAMIPPLFVLPLGVETIPGGTWSDAKLGTALSKRHLGGWRKAVL